MTGSFVLRTNPILSAVYSLQDALVAHGGEAGRGQKEWCQGPSTFGIARIKAVK